MHNLYITTKILICQEKISFFTKNKWNNKTKKNKKEKGAISHPAKKGSN